MLFYKVIAMGAVLASTSFAAAMAGDTETCAQGGVLDRIQARFSYTAANYLNSDIAISDLDRVRENRLVELGESQNVERHYCQARAVMSDGKKRDIWYVVESPWGFAGIGEGITYCVSGLDPLHLHGRFCKSVR